MSLFDNNRNYDDVFQVNTQQVTGVMLGKIISLKDPYGKNRVKCGLISGDKDLNETTWAYVATPFGGANSGLFFHPNVDDIVVIAYEKGDMNLPIIIGSLWYHGGKENIKPPITLDSKEPKNFAHEIRTPKNNSFILSDEEGKEQISLTTPKGSKVLIDDESEIIKLSDKSGKNAIIIDSKKGSIEIKAEQKLNIKVGSASISIDGTSGKIVIKGEQAVNINTAQFAAEATGTASVKANGELTLESSGMTSLKGTMVKIN